MEKRKKIEPIKEQIKLTAHVGRNKECDPGVVWCGVVGSVSSMKNILRVECAPAVAFFVAVSVAG